MFRRCLWSFKVISHSIILMSHVIQLLDFVFHPSSLAVSANAQSRHEMMHKVHVSLLQRSKKMYYVSHRDLKRDLRKSIASLYFKDGQTIIRKVSQDRTVRCKIGRTHFDSVCFWPGEKQNISWNGLMSEDPLILSKVWSFWKGSLSTWRILDYPPAC